MKKLAFLTLSISLLLSFFSCAQEIDSKYYSKNGLVAEGYDLVSYLNPEGPQKGQKKYRASFEGQIFLFSNEENKIKFNASPEKYIPKYGGWCAYAMGIDGSKVKIDPMTYKIIDDELYLFYNFNFTNTLNKWNEKEIQLKSSADSFWSSHNQ